MGLSEELFDRAVKVIPGGVNSPVRAYGAIGIAPRFIDRADGCHIYDVDGKEYVDYIDSWGPMILGHNFPEVKESVLKACEKGLSFGCATAIEVEMAEFICDHIPHVDMVRMVNSGTEAVMSAVRVARGFTGKNKIIKFAGCYHGHSDAMLVSAGSGVMTSGVPDSAGVPKGCTEDTMTAVYNDLDSVRALMEQADGQTAAVIVEAVGANMGVVPPKKGFLEGLRKRRTIPRPRGKVGISETTDGRERGDTGCPTAKARNVSSRWCHIEVSTNTLDWVPRARTDHLDDRYTMARTFDGSL